MRRRDFIGVLITTAAGGWPLDLRAQQARRIGILTLFATDAETRARIDAFKRSLESYGWTEGKNIIFDERILEGAAGQLGPVSAEMVKASPDLILAVATPVLVALQKETRTVPLLFVNVSDPVDGGFVQSMARPGGNVTGFTSFEYSIGGKWVELLKEVVPSLSRVMVILNPENYTSRSLLRIIESVAPRAGVSVVSARVRNQSQIEPAITEFGSKLHGGLIILPDPLTTAHRAQIAQIAASLRLPSIYAFRFFAVDGGLMSYGTNVLDIFRRAGEYADRILKGAHVAEMPVQNPVKYNLTINLKTARIMELDIPSQMLARADEVIE